MLNYLLDDILLDFLSGSAAARAVFDIALHFDAKNSLIGQPACSLILHLSDYFFVVLKVER